jgi:small subunit ribosomal protein S2
MTLITLGELLDAGVHFGHQSSRWNPKMFPYIYTEQNGIHVIDLVQTARLLTHAYNYVQKASKEGKSFLFIGTKRQAAAIIAEEAQKCGGHYVNNRWLGGILTNWSTVQNRVSYLKELNQREADGELDRLPKKRSCFITS